MSKRVVHDIYGAGIEDMVRRMEPWLTDAEVARDVKRLDEMGEYEFGVWLGAVHVALKGDER